MFRMTTLGCFTLAFSVYANADSLPQQTYGTVNPVRPCQADVARFCQNVPPGGGRIIACIRQNRANLSDGCKQHLKQMHDQREQRGPYNNPNMAPAPQP